MRGGRAYLDPLDALELIAEADGVLRLVLVVDLLVEQPANTGSSISQVDAGTDHTLRRHPSPGPRRR